MAEKSVFISYHRKSEAGSGLARSLELALTQRGYDVFLDVDSIAAGLWSPQIETELPRRKHFLFILTPGVLERCANPDNWMRREYDLAIATNRNIVPVRSAGFDDALERSRCPPAMQGIFEWQMARVGLATFKKDFPEFVERFLVRPAAKPEPKPVQRVAGGEPVERGGAGSRRNRPWLAKAWLALLAGGLVFGGWLVLWQAPPLQEPGPEPELPARDQRTAQEEVPSPTPSTVAEEPASREPVQPPPRRQLGAGDRWTSPSGIVFRFVSGGTYWIGSPAAGEPGGPEPGRFDHETRHQVKLSQGFWLAETELTQAQWKQLVPRNPSYFTACGEDCPVERVSWYEAVGLANELSKREGLDECYRLSCSGEMGTGGYTCTRVEFLGFGCAGYRLPTESEWEVAARSGEETALYTGGITLSEGMRTAPELQGIAWYTGNSGGRPQPVRGRTANAWGLHDMLGNVYEWVWDRGGVYPTGVVPDPVGPEDGSYRVFRGGSWISYARDVRAACRFWPVPGDRYSNLGFRFARGQGRGAPSAEPQE